MMKDVVIVDANKFINFFTNFKNENIICGSLFINDSGHLSFYYIDDGVSMPFMLTPSSLVEKMCYDKYEVIFDSSENKRKIMVWKE